MRLRPLILVTLAAFCIMGCDKKQNNSNNTGGGNPPSDPLDQYGVPASQQAGVYERPGTPIRIDFIKSLQADANFTDPEIAFIKKALDKLSNAELIALDIHLLQGNNVSPTSQLPLVQVTPNFHSVQFIFRAPFATRPLDPELGNLLLAALGFPDRKVSATSLNQTPVQSGAIAAVKNPVVPALGLQIISGSGQGGSIPQIMGKKKGPFFVTSPQSPTFYVPVESVASEAATQDLITPTNENNLFPHGNFKVVPQQYP